jgi:hypothetical protein
MSYRFSSYSSYAEASFQDVLQAHEREGAYVAEAAHFETNYLENRGDSTFAVRPLPMRAQFAPVYGIAPGDYDGDGQLDVLLAGNSYATKTLSGRYDAMVGLLLRGDGAGRFETIHYAQSGFFVDGSARAIAAVARGTGPPLMVVSQNSDSLQAFGPRGEQRTQRLRSTDRYALLTFEDGTTRREELYYGDTYLSQSSRVVRLAPSVVEAVVVERDGTRRTLHPETVASRAVHGDDGE